MSATLQCAICGHAASRLCGQCGRFFCRHCHTDGCIAVRPPAMTMARLVIDAERAALEVPAEWQIGGRMRKLWGPLPTGSISKGAHDAR